MEHEFHVWLKDRAFAQAPRNSRMEDAERMRIATRVVLFVGGLCTILSMI